MPLVWASQKPACLQASMLQAASSRVRGGKRITQSSQLKPEHVSDLRTAAAYFPRGPDWGLGLARIAGEDQKRRGHLAAKQAG
jgi:hypothetical protein